MSDRFRCSVCGEEHEGLATDVAYTLPDVVWAMPESERAEKALFTDDLCQFGDRYFIRCVLHVPILHRSHSFGWGAWAEIDQPTFRRYLEIYDQDGALEPACVGTVANELAAYTDTLGAPVSIQFGSSTQRPVLYLGAEDKSRLALEQRDGVDTARYHEILGLIAQH